MTTPQPDTPWERHVCDVRLYDWPKIEQFLQIPRECRELYPMEVAAFVERLCEDYAVGTFRHPYGLYYPDDNPRRLPWALLDVTLDALNRYYRGRGPSTPSPTLRETKAEPSDVLDAFAQVHFGAERWFRAAMVAFDSQKHESHSCDGGWLQLDASQERCPKCSAAGRAVPTDLPVVGAEYEPWFAWFRSNRHVFGAILWYATGHRVTLSAAVMALLRKGVRAERAATAAAASVFEQVDVGDVFRKLLT